MVVAATTTQGSWERWRFLRKVVRASGFIPEMKNILTQFTDSELATGSLPDDNTGMAPVLLVHLSHRFPVPVPVPVPVI